MLSSLYHVKEHKENFKYNMNNMVSDGASDGGCAFKMTEEVQQ